jgi:hypothetical protein
MKRRGLLILISDCFDDAEALLQSVGVLRRRGHEIIVLQIWDREELDFPFSRWARFENLEDDEDFVLLDPAAIRLRYLQVLEKFRATLLEGLRKHEVDLVPLVTDESLAAALKAYLALRAKH